MGGLLVLSASLGMIAIAKRNNAKLYGFYTLFSILMFITELVLIVYLLSIFKRVETLYTTPYSRNITDTTTQSVSDFVYSAYTTCCTGCPVSICGQNLNGTTYCDQTLTPPKCTWVYPCDVQHSSDPVCFISKNSQGFTPTWDIPPSFCTMLKNSAWGATHKPIVGDIGLDSALIASCGGGNPKLFALSMSEFMYSNYGWLSAIVGIVMFVQIWAIVSAYASTRHTMETYRPPKAKDQMRPFV
jgi:hypothetical protein